jgi:hypothetical protein
VQAAHYTLYSMFVFCLVMAPGDEFKPWLGQRTMHDLFKIYEEVEMQLSSRVLDLLPLCTEPLPETLENWLCAAGPFPISS